MSLFRYHASHFDLEHKSRRSINPIETAVGIVIVVSHFISVANVAFFFLICDDTAHHYYLMVINLSRLTCDDLSPNESTTWQVFTLNDVKERKREKEKDRDRWFRA